MCIAVVFALAEYKVPVAGADLNSGVVRADAGDHAGFRGFEGGKWRRSFHMYRLHRCYDCLLRWRYVCESELYEKADIACWPTNLCQYSNAHEIELPLPYTSRKDF